MKSFEVKADGIWANVEWTDKARSMIAAREYRYLGPSFFIDKATNNVVAIKGAGLVHVPAMNLVALASAEDDGDALEVVSATARFAVALGLDPDADETEVLAAIASSTTPDPTMYTPIDAVLDLKVTTAALQQEKLVSKIDWAVVNGYITPALRDWATSLCQLSPASFDDFISSHKPAWADLFAPTGLDERELPTHKRETELEVSMCRQLGLAPGSLRG